MADLIRDVSGPLIAQLAADHDLIWRDHRMIATVGVGVGGPPTTVRFVFPSRVPFVLFKLLPSSIRTYDMQIVRSTFRSRERTFVDDPIPLECFGTVLSAGSEGGDIPPAIFFGNEEMVWTLERFFPCNPFELYPGLGNDSIITLGMRGTELWPKGSQVKPADLGR